MEGRIAVNAPTIIFCININTIIASTYTWICVRGIAVVVVVIRATVSDFAFDIIRVGIVVNTVSNRQRLTHNIFVIGLIKACLDFFFIHRSTHKPANRIGLFVYAEFLTEVLLLLNLVVVKDFAIFTIKIF